MSRLLAIRERRRQLQERESQELLRNPPKLEPAHSDQDIYRDPFTLDRLTRQAAMLKELAKSEPQDDPYKTPLQYVQEKLDRFIVGAEEIRWLISITQCDQCGKQVADIISHYYAWNRFYVFHVRCHGAEEKFTLVAVEFLHRFKNRTQRAYAFLDPYKDQCRQWVDQRLAERPGCLLLTNRLIPASHRLTIKKVSRRSKVKRQVSLSIAADHKPINLEVLPPEKTRRKITITFHSILYKLWFK